MVDSTKCPVCGRKGIPDYQNDDVRCPDCGSNLKVFRILDSIEQDAKAKSTIWKPVGIMAMLAALLFAILFFTKGSSPTADKERFSLLEDSIAALNEKINDMQNPQLASQQEEGEEVAAPEADKKEAGEAAQENAGDEKAKEEDSKKEDITAPAGKVFERNGKKYYKVQKGDSWWNISRKLYEGKVTDAELAKMNGKDLKKPLEIGEEIIVK